MKTHSIRNVPGQVLVPAVVRRVFVDLPLLMRVGLGLAVLGAVIDVGYHLVTDAPGMGHGSVAFIGHMTTFVGMVVTMLGLFGVAFNRRSDGAKTTQKGESR